MQYCGKKGNYKHMTCYHDVENERGMTVNMNTQKYSTRHS